MPIIIPLKHLINLYALLVFQLPENMPSYCDEIGVYELDISKAERVILEAEVKRINKISIHELYSKYCAEHNGMYEGSASHKILEAERQTERNALKSGVK